MDCSSPSVSQLQSPCHSLATFPQTVPLPRDRWWVSLNPRVLTGSAGLAKLRTKLMDNDPTTLKPRRGSVWLGLVLGVLFTVLYFELRRYVPIDPIHWVILLSVLQWIYILPLVFILRAKRQPRTAIGLLIVGLLVTVAVVAPFMLNLFPHAF